METQSGATSSSSGTGNPALDSRAIIEQAKGSASVRCGVTPDIAYEMIQGLTRSQRREIHEFCAEVLANGGRLDGIGPLTLHT